MFSKPVIMLKATSHTNPKRKTRPGSLLTRTCFSFWIYTATAVHEAGTSVSANGYGLILISHLYFQTASLLLRPRP